jgi:hypothetical protein
MGRNDGPVKKCHPVVDAILGGSLVALMCWYFHHCYQTFDTNPDEVFLFLGCGAFTMVAIPVVRYLAGLFGQWITKARSGEGIPKETRDPLGTPVAMKKFVDQAWQLAIHFGMSCWEVRIILQNPDWYNDPRTTLCCPGHGITASCVVSKELNTFFVLQLAMWLMTVGVAKRIITLRTTCQDSPTSLSPSRVCVFPQWMSRASRASGSRSGARTTSR